MRVPRGDANTKVNLRFGPGSSHPRLVPTDDDDDDAVRGESER